jgi:hypothetical protein
MKEMPLHQRQELLWWLQEEQRSAERWDKESRRITRVSTYGREDKFRKRLKREITDDQWDEYRQRIMQQPLTDDSLDEWRKKIILKTMAEIRDGFEWERTEKAADTEGSPR